MTEEEQAQIETAYIFLVLFSQVLRLKNEGLEVTSLPEKMQMAYAFMISPNKDRLPVLKKLCGLIKKESDQDDFYFALLKVESEIKEPTCQHHELASEYEALSQHFESLYPNICELVKNRIDNALEKKENPQSCATMARRM